MILDLSRAKGMRRSPTIYTYYQPEEEKIGWYKEMIVP